MRGACGDDALTGGRLRGESDVRSRRRTLCALLNVIGYKSDAEAFSAPGECTVQELWALQAHRDALRQSVHDAWTEANLDVVLCPPHCLPATPHGTFPEVTATAWWCYIFNLVRDVPAADLLVQCVVLTVAAM